jgi:hypothetical protein
MKKQMLYCLGLMNALLICAANGQEGDATNDVFQHKLGRDIDSRIQNEPAVTGDYVRDRADDALRALDERRELVNRYGGGSAMPHDPPESIEELERRIPWDYRLKACQALRGGASQSGAVPEPASISATSDNQQPTDNAQGIGIANKGTQREGTRFLAALDDARIAVIARAILFDQKNLLSRYLRVRSNDGVVLLDGFVRDRLEEQMAAEKLAQVKEVRRVVTSCTVNRSLGGVQNYDTKISGLAGDLLVAGRIGLAIGSAKTSGQLPRTMNLIAVDVFKGAARIFAIGEGPDLDSKIAQLVGKLQGVHSCQVFIGTEAKR